MSRENDRSQSYWKEPPKETSYEAHLRRKRLKQQQRSRASKTQIPGQEEDLSRENYETPSAPSRQRTRQQEDFSPESYDTESPRRAGTRPPPSPNTTSTPTDVYDTEPLRRQDTRPPTPEEPIPYETESDRAWESSRQRERERIDRRSASYSGGSYRPGDRGNRSPVRDRRVTEKKTKRLPEAKQRKAWPWLLAGCAGGILTIALVVAIVLVVFFRSTLGGTLFGGVFNQTFTQKNVQTFKVSNFSLIQINNKVGGVASNITIVVDPTASVTTITTVKKVQAANSNDANKEFARIPLILSPVISTTPALILTICTQGNTTCGGNIGDSVDVTITLPTSTTTNGTYLFDIELRVGIIGVQQAQLAAGSCLSTGTGNVTFKGNFDTANSSNLNPCGSPTSNAHPWYKIHSEVGNLDITPFPTIKNVLLDGSTTAGKINSDGFNLPIQTSNGSQSYYGPLIPNTPQPTAQLTLDVGSGDINLHKI